MIKKEIDIKLIETFVYDCERMFLLNFDNTEYEINQTSLIIRKLLIDTPGIMSLWNCFFYEKFRLYSGTPTEKYEEEYLNSLKLYIPLLDILPNVVINNYSSIRLKDKSTPSSYLTKTFNISVKELSINKYLLEDFVVLDGIYVSRKDIIEYVAYAIGAIHYNVKQKKLDRIKNVKKLNFGHAIGIEKQDSMLFFNQSFRTSEDKKLIDTSELNDFIVKLGDRHTFDSLMILQIIHEMRASPHITQLYIKAKEYLINNHNKYGQYEINSNFTLVERKKNKR